MKRSLSMLWVLALVAVATVGIAVTFSPETVFAGDSGDNKK